MLSGLPRGSWRVLYLRRPRPGISLPARDPVEWDPARGTRCPQSCHSPAASRPSTQRARIPMYASPCPWFLLSPCLASSLNFSFPLPSSLDSQSAFLEKECGPCRRHCCCGYCGGPRWIRLLPCTSQASGGGEPAMSCVLMHTHMNVCPHTCMHVHVYMHTHT